MLSRLIGLYHLLDAGTRRRLPVSAALGLIVAVAEACGIGMVFPLLLALSDPVRVQGSTWFAWLFALFGATSLDQFVARAGGAIVGLLILKNVLALAIVRWQIGFLAQQECALSERLFANCLHMPYEAFSRRNSADLIQGATGEVSTAISGFLLPAVGLLVELAVIAGLVGIVILIDPMAALSIMASMVVAAYLFDTSMRRWLRRIGEQLITANASVLRRLQEGIGAAKEIRVLGRAGALESEFARARRHLAGLRRTQTFVGTLPRAYLEIVLLLSLVVVAWASLLHRPIAEAVSILAVFGAAGLRLLPSVNRVLSLLQQMNVAGPSVDHVLRELGSTRPEAGEPVRANPVPAVSVSTSAPRASKQPMRSGLLVSGVHYSYPDRESAALSGVTLQVPWGQSIGLVGSSGSGKSTLVDLILGLRHPVRGRILADGADIAADIIGWQRRIGYVPQQIALIDAPIWRNITLGIPVEEIDQRRLTEVVELAHLAEVADGLPEGLDTIVGEDGARLSGGQRQRIGIARALYHDPDVLILDEATSALDNMTESKIARMLGELAGVKTMIVVAHRLSTVRRCDNVVVLKEGVCVGQGPFDELAGSNREFANLVRAGSH